MSVFDDLLRELEQYESEDDKLNITLERLFEDNGVSDKCEQIPVFFGTIGRIIGNSNLRRVENITSAWCSPITYNPYDDYRTFYTAVKNKSGITEGNRIVFVAECDNLQHPNRIIRVADFYKLKDLGLKDDAGQDIILNRIINHSSRDGFGKYRDKIRDLLSEKKAIEEIKSELESLKEKQVKYLEFAREHFPQGLDLLREECEALNNAKEQLTKQISELKEEKDEFEKAAGQLAIIQEQLNTVVPPGETAEDVINALKRYDEQKDDIERAKKFAEWYLTPETDIQSLTTVSPEDMCSIEYLRKRLRYEYSDDVLIPVLSAMATDQILILYGKPGTGKTSFVQSFSDAIRAKCTMISVQNNWTDKSDILGYFNPITTSFVSTPFLEALLNAKNEFEKNCINNASECRLHIICLDEMNLARIEYYFAEFLHLMQLDNEERELHILPPDIERQVENLINEKPQNEGESREYSKDEKMLLLLAKYMHFKIPPNVRFVGTINNDDTTNNLSPKVIDRSFFIELTRDDYSEDKAIEKPKDFYPASFFAPTEKAINNVPGLSVFKDENGRFKKYLRQMYSFYTDKLHQNKENDFVSYLILSKILPSIKKVEDFTGSEYNNSKYEKVRIRYSRHNPTSEYLNFLGG